MVDVDRIGNGMMNPLGSCFDTVPASPGEQRCAGHGAARCSRPGILSLAGAMAYQPFIRASVRSILVMIDFLACLEPPALDELAGLFSIVEYSAGSAIDERDKDGCAFVVVTGAVNVRLKKGSGDSLVLKTLQPSGLFGAVRRTSTPLVLICAEGAPCERPGPISWTRPADVEGCRLRC
jgi:hypothetical protein